MSPGEVIVRIHPYAAERLEECGALPSEIEATVLGGESFPAKLGRTGYRRNFPFGGHLAVQDLRHQAGRGLCGAGG